MLARTLTSAEGLDAPDRIRTSASLEGERCHRFEPWRVWTRPTGFEPQRAWKASGVTGSNPGGSGRARQDSNLSEPGRRAVSQVRTLAGLDAPDRIRTCDLRF